MARWLKIIEPISLLSVPTVLFIGAYFQIEATALFTLLTVIAALVPFFLRFELQKPRARDIMPIVVLAAVACAGRLIFAALPNFKPVLAIVIVSGICFGKQSGFLTGSLAALASNLFFGQGAWTPWQMYAFGLAGYVAGILAENGVFKRSWTVYVYGFLAAMVYGLLLDSWSIVGFVRPLTLSAALVTYGAGMPFNVSHAVATVVFLLPIFLPWSKKLERIKRKYGIHTG